MDRRPALPRQHPPIETIDQIQDPDLPIEMAYCENTPENTFLRAMVARILFFARQRGPAYFQQKLTNEFLESFLRETSRYIEMKSDDLTEVIQAMPSPNRLIRSIRMRDILSTIRLRVAISIQALQANDPQLAMSLLWNRTFRGINALVLGHATDLLEGTDLPPVSGEHMNDLHIILDSAYRANRVAIREAELPQFLAQITNEARRCPDRFLQIIPMTILEGASNRTTIEFKTIVAKDNIRVPLRHILDLTRATNNDPTSRAFAGTRELYLSLTSWIRVWSARAQNPSYTHFMLPSPPIAGSIYAHATADAAEMMGFLADVCDLVRRVHVHNALELPEDILTFTVQYRRGERHGLEYEAVDQFLRDRIARGL